VLLFIILKITVYILPGSPLVLNFIWYGVFLNVFLFAFNILPIPPLDGSHILFDLFPNRITARLLGFGFYGSFILLIFIYSPLWNIFMKLVNSILGLFLLIGGYE